MRAAVAWLMKQLERRPFTTNAATGGVLGFLGDVICQKAVEGQASRETQLLQRRAEPRVPMPGKNRLAALLRDDGVRGRLHRVCKK
jgi:hypothetical protein